MQKSLFVNSFGRGRILDNEGNRILLRTKKSYELFFYLFQERNEYIAKEDLLDNIFSDMDEEKAGNNLHTTIYQIRKSFANYGYEEVIQYKSGTYFLNVDIISDYDEINDLLLSDIKDDSLVRLLELYKGKYFEKDKYQWAENVSEDFHSQILLKVKKLILSGTISNAVLVRFISVFKEDSFSDVEMLNLILNKFKQKNDYVKIKTIVNEANDYWLTHFSRKLPEYILREY